MRLHPLMLAVCVIFGAQDVRADAKVVSLGEISVPQSVDATMAPRLTAAVQDELRQLDLSHARRQAVVSVSVVRLDSEPRAKGSAFTCVVSATLRNPKTGAVFAIVEGRARAEGESPRSLESSALRGAVHGAVTRIPDALSSPR